MKNFRNHLIWAAVALCCGAVTAPAAAAKVEFDKVLMVNPITVCDNAGANCAATTLFPTFFSDTLLQAKVATVVLPGSTINNTALLNVNGVADVNKVGNGQSTNAMALNAWFVNSLAAAPGSTLFGEGYVNGNGVVINTSAVTSNNRTDTFTHEIGHNLGLDHDTFGAGAATNLMTRGSLRTPPASGLTADQITQIRASQFVQEAPKVTVDLRGSTPFDTSDFFRVSFDAGPTEISLRRLTIDLAPAGAFFDPTSASPGNSGSPFRTSSLSGVASSDITVNGSTDGSQLMSLNFKQGAFTKGDSFSFGNDIDLFSAIDFFGATPDELIGILFTFEFDFGLVTETSLDSALVVDSTNVTRLLPTGANPVPVGPQVPTGQLPPVGVVGTPDPVVISAVPEPESLLLVGMALAALATVRRRLAAR